MDFLWGMSFCIWVCRLLRNVGFEGSLELFLQWHLMTTECQTFRQFQIIASGLLLIVMSKWAFCMTPSFLVNGENMSNMVGYVRTNRISIYIYRFNITWEIVSKKLTHQICFFVGQFFWFHFFQSIISTFRSLLSTSPHFHGNQGNPLCYPPSKEGLIAGY